MLSVVVCTRNRPEMLARCLEALTLQNGTFEVLVVDQSDASVSLLDDPRFRRIADKERGLAAGRNAGLRAAAGNVVAFIDDDAVPDPEYLRALERAFEEDPKLVAAAGRILTLEDGSPYARVHNSDIRILGKRDWLFFMGGNFAVLGDVAHKIGPFDERFGAGRRWASGEETDYFFRMLYRNCRVAYVPAATVRHPRETVDYASSGLRTKLLAYGRGQGAIIARHLIDFANYRMFATLLWTVMKPCFRAVQYTLTLQPRRAMLHVAVAFGKCAGFAEFVQTAARAKRKSNYSCK
jgi:glycosyltransferase involved in cell wall biosynthesis